MWADADADTDLVAVFPPAASGCMRLRAVAERQPAGRTVVGVQLPGREDRLAEPPAETADIAAAAVASELAALPRRRLGLLGISLGGLLAYLVARQFERDGDPVDEICIAAARSPEFWLGYPAEPPQDEIDAMLGPGWRESPAGPYAAEVLHRDLRLAAGYDIGPAVLEHTPLRTVSGHRDVVVGEEQMRRWRARAARFRGQRVLDVTHRQFLDRDVLEPMIDDLFTAPRAQEVPC